MALAVGGFALLWVLFVPSQEGFFIGSHEVIEYRVLDDGLVEYAYKGETLPERIVPDEEIALRTESSYTRKLEDGAYEARVYSGKSYVADIDAWHYREIATTTQQELTKAVSANPLAFLFVKRAYAVDVYSGAGDGYVVNLNGSSSTWNTVRNASIGNSRDYTSSPANVGVLRTQIITAPSHVRYYIYRVFLPFDTSSIPSGAVVSAATLSIYVTYRNDTMTENVEYITVVQTSNPNHSSLTTDDFDQCGVLDSPTEGVDVGNRKQVSGFTLNSYGNFSLNATGRSWISRSGESSTCSATTGITCLGLREGHDTTNTSPTVNNRDSLIQFSTSEQTGTSNDPYLSITYTAPVTITTDSASNLTDTTATLNATISDTGGDSADTCGFAWGTNSSLSGGDTATTTDSTCPATTGSFTRNLTSLVASTAYYFRAYGTNSANTGYGDIETFTTGEPPPPEVRVNGNTRLQGLRLYTY